MVIILFLLQKTKLYIPVVTLSTRDNQKLSKFLGKGYQRSVYWNEFKTKSDNKNATNEFRYFLKLNFVGVNSLFVLVYIQIMATMLKDLMRENIIYQKV